jgi:hypothetical protein
MSSRIRDALMVLNDNEIAAIEVRDSAREAAVPDET